MARSVRPKRRGFSVQEQLLGKYGPGTFGALLDQLQSRTAKPKSSRRRRRRPVRKPVTS